MRRSVLKVAAVAAVGVLAFAGCGGDDDDDDNAGGSGGSGGGGTVTEAEFQDQADAICRDYEQRLDAKSDELTEQAANASLEEFGQIFADEILPLLRDELDALQDLPTPDENADAYEDLFNDLEDAAGTIEEMAKDDPETLFGDNSEDPFAELDQRALDLGLDDCGSADE